VNAGVACDVSVGADVAALHQAAKQHLGKVTALSCIDISFVWMK
jgi:hypothetical protein